MTARVDTSLWRSGYRSGIRVFARHASIAVIAVALMVSARARADRPSSKSDLASQVVFVGLLPLDKADGQPDLIALKTAQTIRPAVEAALSEQSHQPVVGHDALTERLGKGYLPKWFACKSDVTCLTRLLAPVKAAGYSLAITGDYYVAEGVYHVRLVTFLLLDGTVGKEIRIDLPEADVRDQHHWLEALRPLRASRNGRLRIASNVGGVTCTIDSESCEFESDGQTLSAPPGEHTIELSKDGYLPEKLVVNIEIGTTQDVAIALKPKPTELKVVEAGGPRRKPTLTAVRTDKVIEIDGKLDDAAWQKAWIETNFTQNYPDEGKPPSQRTELRVLYDDDAVYVGIRCFDSEPAKIVSRLTRRDRDIEADRVTVSISSRNDKLTAYAFQVNAAGVQLDGTRFADVAFSLDWDGVWFSAVSHDDKGWTAELKIPLSALRYSGDATAFGFQVRRYIERRHETDEWSYIPRSVQAEVSSYGTLEGLAGLHAKRLLQIAPYDSRRATVRTRQGALDGTELGGNLGADVKLGLTPDLTLDATVNPDFGTVEVDQRVLNLSTTEVEFPEKRPFFQEGSYLFAPDAAMQVNISPLQLLYTRRIGQTPPQTEVSGADVELAQPPPQGQILGALRATGRLAHRLSVALIDAVTARADAVVTRSPGSLAEKVLVAPLTNTGVMRLLQQFGQNSSIGVMATAVTRAESANLAAPMPGDGCPAPHYGVFVAGPAGGRCTNDAYTGEADMTLRTDSGEWGASGQVVGSVLRHGPSRFVPDGTEIRPGDNGWGVNAEAGRYGGEHLLSYFHFAELSPKLEINDAGYMPNANYIAFKNVTVLRWTHPVIGLQDTRIELDTDYEIYADTYKPYTGGPSLEWDGTLPNFWAFGLFAGFDIARYNNRETQDGALQRTPFHPWTGAELKTDLRKPWTVSLDVHAYPTPRGITTAGEAGLSVHPASSVELDLFTNISWSSGDPRWVFTQTNADSSRTYYFQDLASQSWDVQLRGTWTLSTQLSLQTYAQMFLDSGQYGKGTAASGSGSHPLLDTFVPAIAPATNRPDFSDTQLNLNMFLRWEYRPGSTLWLAYTRAQLNSPYDPMQVGRIHFDHLYGPTTDVFLIKLSYLWEPLLRRR
jgi:hypothetical protein